MSSVADKESITKANVFIRQYFPDHPEYEVDMKLRKLLRMKNKKKTSSRA
jgi:hypothetical protein